MSRIKQFELKSRFQALDIRKFYEIELFRNAIHLENSKTRIFSVETSCTNMRIFWS